MINSENFFHLIGGSALSLIGLVTIATGLNANVQADQMHATNIKQLQATQHKEAERSDLERQKANSRYKNGCVILANQIKAGQTVDGVPPKTQVCDIYGLTGVITPVDGILKITDVVRTPDQDVIQARVSR